MAGVAPYLKRPVALLQHPGRGHQREKATRR